MRIFSRCSQSDSGVLFQNPRRACGDTPLNDPKLGRWQRRNPSRNKGAGTVPSNRHFALVSHQTIRVSHNFKLEPNTTPTQYKQINMMRFLLLTSLLSVAHCFTEQRSLRNPKNLVLHNLPDQDFVPCWQDLYDDDCSMDAVYQSSFVASEWLKSMPCLANIEVRTFVLFWQRLVFFCAFLTRAFSSTQDCDIPEELKLPGNKHEEGLEPVDVLKVLNIKRAKGLSVNKNDKFQP